MAKETSFNIILIILFVFACIGLYWLERLGLEAGSAYLWLILIGAVFILIAVTKHNSADDFWFSIPIDTTNERALVMLIFGLVFMGIILGAGSLSHSSSITPALIAPLAFGKASPVGLETFATLVAATSPFWQFFILVPGAATIEELVLGFAFVLMGSLVFGYGLRTLLHLDFGEVGDEYWDFFGAIFFSMILFTVLHYFNQTYLNIDGSLNWSVFGYAAGFRLVLNLLIYKFGSWGIMFGIGAHAMNNAVYLGWNTILQALGTFPGGYIMIFMLVLFAIYGALSFQILIEDGWDALGELLTFNS